MVNRSQKKVIWHERVEKADDACPKNSPAGIHGVVVSTSEIYVCHVPAEENGILPIGLNQGKPAPSKTDSLVVISWNSWLIRGILTAVAVILVGLVISC